MVQSNIRSVTLIGAVVAFAFLATAPTSTGETHEKQYPFAYSTQLYGYVPTGLRYQTASLRIYAFDDATGVEVRELGTGALLGQGLIDKWEVLTVAVNRGQAFKAVSDKPISGLLGAYPGYQVCPGMSFVPSRENEGKEFVLDFPDTGPGYGLPNQHYLTLFAWEDADVVVKDVSTGIATWEGFLASGYYKKLIPAEGRYSVSSTGVLTVELVLAYDNSTFILDEDQDGCGTEFMFHVYSVGLGYGRHSYYEVHAFEDASVKVYDIDDPSSPVLFDEFTLSEGEHYVNVFDFYDNVFRIESTGKVSGMAGSNQTDVGGVPGAQSIGDLYTSVPSLDGKGKRFLLGLHCPNMHFGKSGFSLIASEDNTTVDVEGDVYTLDRDEWTWIAQPDTGIFYYEIVSDKQIRVLTGSIGGDDDFDNVMTYLPGEYELEDICEPRCLKENVMAELDALDPQSKHVEKGIKKAKKHIEKSLKSEYWLDETHLVCKKGKKVFSEEKKAVKDIRKLCQGEKCKGVTSLSLIYHGAEEALIEAISKKKTCFGPEMVSPGETFEIEAVDEKLGANTEIWKNGSLDEEIHTSCSKPLEEGMVFGDFEVEDVDKIGEEEGGFPSELCERLILMLVKADSILARVAIDDAIAANGNPKEIEKAEKEMAKAEKDKKKGKYDKAINHYKKAWEHACKAMKSPKHSQSQMIRETKTEHRTVLLQNSPNPVTTSTRFAFVLEEPASVRLAVYDVVGRPVWDFVSSSLNEGLYAVEWDCKDSDGRFVPSGVYLYKLETDSFSQTRKMVVLR